MYAYARTAREVHKCTYTRPHNHRRLELEGESEKVSEIRETPRTAVSTTPSFDLPFRLDKHPPEVFTQRVREESRALHCNS